LALDLAIARHSVCRLQTIGRRTGRPREIEIWFAADPHRDRIYILSGGRDRAHWVRNIERAPAVRVRIGERRFAGMARRIEGEPDEILARHLVAGKYGYWQQGTELSGWARDSLPMAIDLIGEGEPATLEIG
jgi:deazaflavin-dependent oxidoreductase (nitroreductase family)